MIFRIELHVRNGGSQTSCSEDVLTIETQTESLTFGRLYNLVNMSLQNGGSEIKVYKQDAITSNLVLCTEIEDEYYNGLLTVEDDGGYRVKLFIIQNPSSKVTTMISMAGEGNNHVKKEAITSSEVSKRLGIGRGISGACGCSSDSIGFYRTAQPLGQPHVSFGRGKRTPMIRKKKN